MDEVDDASYELLGVADMSSTDTELHKYGRRSAGDIQRRLHVAQSPSSVACAAALRQVCMRPRRWAGVCRG